MKKFTLLRSVATPIRRENVDTDLIIPARHLTGTTREGYGQHLFGILKVSDPSFPLNDPRFTSSAVMITNENFGCGSSREHAVWALAGAGYRCLIGKSFSDIFRNNCGKNGVLLITLPASVIDEMMQAAEEHDLEVTVNLELQKVQVPGRAPIDFDCDPFLKECLLKGVDELDYIISHQAAIDTFKTEQAKEWFYASTKVNR